MDIQEPKQRPRRHWIQAYLFATLGFIVCLILVAPPYFAKWRIWRARQFVPERHRAATPLLELAGYGVTEPRASPFDEYTIYEEGERYSAEVMVDRGTVWRMVRVGESQIGGSLSEAELLKRADRFAEVALGGPATRLGYAQPGDALNLAYRRGSSLGKIVIQADGFISNYYRERS